jgi:Protein of unknown function (DUF3047)
VIKDALYCGPGTGEMPRIRRVLPLDLTRDFLLTDDTHWKLDGLLMSRRLTAKGMMTGAALASMIAGVSPGLAQQAVFGPTLSAAGWTELTFFRKKPAEFTAKDNQTVSIMAQSAVSLIWKRIEGPEASAAKASWRWRVDQGVGPTDLAKKGGDDRSIALYFVFSKEEPEALKTATMTSLLRSGDGKILIYVFGGREARGTVIPSPYLPGRGVTIIQRNADAERGAWLAERADILADAKRIFGADVGRLVAIAVSSDSDDTAGTVKAELSGLTFQ